MSLNPAGTANYGWNYSKPDREGFSLELWGTVVALQEVQAREFSMNGGMGRPRFWEDGNPVMNIRMALACPDGSLKSITFQKAGKKQVSGEKPSLHMDLFRLTNGNMMDLMGKTLHIWTWNNHPQTTAPWGPGNPRLFGVDAPADAPKYELATALPEEFKVPRLLANDAASGGQPMGQPVPAMPNQVVTPTNVPQMANGYYNQMPQYSQPVQQAQPAVPPMAQTQIMPMMPVQQAQPAGMDPAVASAMNAVNPTFDAYDDVPF